MLTIIRKLLQRPGAGSMGLGSAEAYDCWSESYENQTGNLMLDLDENIFSNLIKNIDLKNKRVADIGCGTGRHWQKLYEKNPASILGFDVSAGMLKQLMHKYPFAKTQLTTDNLLGSVPDSSVDCLVTTLTIAHIKNIEEAIGSWSRILKEGSDLVITDFHPAMLARGGKRSFRHGSKSLSVVNYVHTLNKVKRVFNKYGFTLIKEEEIKVNEKVKPYYEAQNALPVYERFKGIPVIYGLYLKKQLAVK